MGLINLVKGLDRITIDSPQKYYVYKYKGEWHTKEALVSRTNKEKSWTDTNKNTTKYRRLTQENLWPRVSIDVELDIAAPIWEGYSITTNGVVLGINNKEVGGKGQQVIIGAGDLRGNYFKSDLMWKAFIDNDYEPTERRTWVAGIQRHEWTQFINSNKISLDEIEIKQPTEKKVESAITAEKNDNVAARLEEALKEIERLKKEIEYLTDPSPQLQPSSSGEPQAREVLFGTAPEINAPTPQYNERHKEPINLKGAAPRVVEIKRQKRGV